jgi:flagellar hook-length control protein FliK
VTTTVVQANASALASATNNLSDISPEVNLSSAGLSMASPVAGGRSALPEPAQPVPLAAGASQTAPSSPSGAAGHQDGLNDKQEPAGGNDHQVQTRPVDAAGLTNPAVFTTPVAAGATQAASTPADSIPSVAKQLATVVSPFTLRPDGSYTLSIKLQPDGLGDVRLDLRVQAGVVDLQLHASGGDTEDLLRQNLDGIRQQLTDAGFSSVNVGVGVGGENQPQWNNQEPSAAAHSTGVPSSNASGAAATAAASFGNPRSQTNDGSVLDLQL